MSAPVRLPVGVAGEIRLSYRAPRADVVAIVQIVEEVEGAGVARESWQREVGVIARAFGRESGELSVPLAFSSPGRKRISLTLLTDERRESDPVAVEVEALPR